MLLLPARSSASSAHWCSQYSIDVWTSKVFSSRVYDCPLGDRVKSRYSCIPPPRSCENVSKLHRRREEKEKKRREKEEKKMSVVVLCVCIEKVWWYHTSRCVYVSILFTYQHGPYLFDDIPARCAFIDLYIKLPATKAVHLEKEERKKRRSDIKTCFCVASLVGRNRKAWGWGDRIQESSAAWSTPVGRARRRRKKGEREEE